MDTKASTFTHKIKDSTAELHLRLESQALLSAIMAPVVTPLQYYYYLLFMKKIEEVYETKVLTRLADIFPELEHTKASQLISDDFYSIDGNTAAKSFVMKEYTIPDEMISIPFAWGYMYVMKGSKLGGKVIYRHIHRTLGYSDSYGAKYIADYGNNTFGFWKEFLLKFSMYVAENNCEDEAIQGAEYAFSSIYDFLETNKLVYEI
ncbi:MAG: biliverdin-producing heme oxygenase [Bacteroidota bacterium]|nr:biliverdin-producing heme oxygenase [Bacteroidota bacterium]